MYKDIDTLNPCNFSIVITTQHTEFISCHVTVSEPRSRAKQQNASLSGLRLSQNVTFTPYPTHRHKEGERKRERRNAHPTHTQTMTINE